MLVCQDSKYGELILTTIPSVPFSSSEGTIYFGRGQGGAISVVHVRDNLNGKVSRDPPAEVGPNFGMID